MMAPTAPAAYEQERSDAMRRPLRIYFAVLAANFLLEFLLVDGGGPGGRVGTLWVRLPEVLIFFFVWFALRRPIALRALEARTMASWYALILLNCAFAATTGPRFNLATILLGNHLGVIACRLTRRMALLAVIVGWAGPLIPMLAWGSAGDLLWWAILLVPTAVVYFAAAGADRLARREYDARTGLEQAHGRLREVEEARTRLFVHLSHDLRTPLALIRGEAEWLGSQLSSGVAAKSLGRIEANATSAADLVEQLLVLARLDQGQSPCARSACELGALVREVAAQLEPPAASGRQVVVEADEGAPAAFADPQHVRRILANLVTNGLRQLTAGGEVRLRVRADGDADVVVEVSDDGAGIPAGRRGRIFERFVSFDAAGSLASGIGLPLARELAELNGGQLTLVDGAPRTTFRLRLPAGAAPGLPAAAAAAAAPVGDAVSQSPSAEPRHRPRLLVVEDHADMRDLLGRLLGERYEVRYAATFAEALPALDEGAAPRAVLCDVLLPDGDGYGVLEHVRRRSALADVPFVFLSALGSPDERARGLAAGADDYLAKPFSAAELAARLAAAVAHADGRREALRAQREDFLAELHDGLAAGLVRARMLLDLGRTDEVRGLIAESMAETRALLAVLDAGQPSWDEVVADLTRHAAESGESAGLAVSVQAASDGTVGRLSPAEAHVLRRVVREAMTNVLKHAGARRVSCSLEVRDAAVRVRVEDDGRGWPADARTRGRGVGVMARRVERLAGRLTLGKSALGGAAVEAIVPVTVGPAAKVA